MTRPGRPSPSFEQLVQTRDMRFILSALLRFLLQGEQAQARALDAMRQSIHARDERIAEALQAFGLRLSDLDGRLAQLARGVEQPHQVAAEQFAGMAGDVLRQLRAEVGRLQVAAGSGDERALASELAPLVELPPLIEPVPPLPTPAPASLAALRRRIEQIDARQRELLEGDRATAA